MGEELEKRNDAGRGKGVVYLSSFKQALIR
jgi:hypothetical protein